MCILNHVVSFLGELSMKTHPIAFGYLYWYQCGSENLHKVISKCLKKWFPSVQKSYLKVFKKFPLSVPKSGPEVFKKVVPKCSKKLPQSVQKSCPKVSQKVLPKCSKKCPKKWSQSDQKSDPKVTSLNLQNRPHLAQISLLNTSHYPARRDKDSLFSSTS